MGSQVAVVGDLAGGAILVLQTLVTVNGVPIAVVGCPIVGHGDPPHAAATMVAGSPVVTINGDPICRTGDLASCGHTAIGTSHITSD